MCFSNKCQYEQKCGTLKGQCSFNEKEILPKDALCKDEDVSKYILGDNGLLESEAMKPFKKDLDVLLGRQ
jgi:hypothetical protein